MVLASRAMNTAIANRNRTIAGHHSRRVCASSTVCVKPPIVPYKWQTNSTFPVSDVARPAQFLDVVHLADVWVSSP
jgi:hypothetical protein